MPIEAKAQIVITGGPESLKTLQGVKRATSDAAKEARQAQKQQESAAKAAQKATEAAARAQVKAAQTAAKAQDKAAKDAARAAEKSQRDIERAAQKEAERWQTLARKSADARIRAQEAVTRAAQREAAKQVETAKRTAAAEAQARKDALRKAGGLLTAGAAGLLAGATVATGTARGIAGVKDIRERITSANEFRERLVRVTNDAGFSAAQREAAQEKVLRTSTSTGMDNDELMGVLEAGQGQFNNLQYFIDQLDTIGRISKASGANAKTLALAIGYANQAFEITGDAAQDSGYLMKAAANIGSVEVNDLANAFAPVAGIFAETTKHKGQSGYKEFLGLAETMNTGGFGAEGSATRAEAFLKAISGVKTQNELKGIGVKGFVGKDGAIDIPALIEKLATNKEFSKASVRQKIFEDVRAQQGVETLVAARNRVRTGVTGAVDVNTFQSLDATSGKASVDSGMAEMQNEGFFKMQQKAAEMQADTVQNLEKYNKDILLVTETSNRLEKAFGRLSLWADAIAAVGVVGGAVNALGKLGGGAAEGGALAKALPSIASASNALSAGAGGALAAGSTAVGAASGAAIGGTVLAGAALGYGAGMLVNSTTSAMRDDQKTFSDLIADSVFESLNSGDARFKEGSTITNLTEDGSKKIVQTMEAGNRINQKVVDAIQTALTQPPPGAPREPR